MEFRKAFFHVIFTVFCALYISICANGCSTVKNGRAISPTDYIRPESIDAAEWAVNDRIGQLERDLAYTRELNRRLTERLERARDEARSIRESSTSIGELSRRSTITLQNIIEEVELLSDWIEWAVARIIYLESLLEE